MNREERSISQPFSEPAQGDRLNPRDILGQMLIIHPTEYIAAMKTPYPNPRRPDGLSDAIKVDVVTLDMINPSTGTNIWRGALWFQNQLILDLKDRIGTLLLGHMSQNAAKPGQNPAFAIKSATADTAAVARAQAWLHQHPEFMHQVPAPPQPPQMQQPTYQQPQQQYQQQYQQYQQPTYPQPVSAPPQPVSAPPQQQQQTVLDRLRRHGEQPFPANGPNQQGFQDQAPF